MPHPADGDPDAGSLIDQAFRHEGQTSKDLKPRHISMIALGGAIGTGLFLGAGLRLQQAGPSLLIIYALCGLCSFMVLRALGHMMMHRPTSGGFVSYAREFLGEGAAYAMGWFYLLNLTLMGIADLSAVALFIHYWTMFGGLPQWLIALAALCIVSAANLIGVGLFGEVEFWLSMVKVLAIVLFLLLGAAILATGMPVGPHHPGLKLIAAYGGFFPHGFLAPLLLIQGVIFAFSCTEMIGVTIGECKDPKSLIKGAINGVSWRIGFFYVGSIALLVVLMPWTVYKAGESPFVTLFATLGIKGMDSIMNLVVLTAALSSLNTLLYTSGRILRALALGGSAPGIFARMNKRKLPHIGLYATICVFLLGVGLNYLLPASAFELALSIASVGLIVTWAIILLSQIRMDKRIKKGELPKTGFPMPFAPYSAYATLAFLGAVIVLMGMDYPLGTYTVCALPFMGAGLWMSWRLIKRHERSRQ